MLRYVGTGRRRYGVHPVWMSSRPCWEFEAVLSGRIGPVLPDRPTDLRRSCLWVFPAGQRHGWTGDGPGTAEVAVFHFPTVPTTLRDLGHDHGPLHAALDDPARRQIRRLAREAVACLRKPSALDELVAQRILLELTVLVLRQVPSRLLPPPPDTNAQRVEAATTWFRDHLHLAPTIAEAARAVHTSPAHLRRLFHAIAGASPRAVLDTLRFERARELLLEGTASQSQIARQCGYTEASAFSRAFTARVGQSPGRWAKAAAAQPRFRQSERSS